MMHSREEAQQANAGCALFIYPILGLAAWYCADHSIFKWIILGVTYLFSSFFALNNSRHKRPADRTPLEIQSPITAALIPLYHGLTASLFHVALLYWALQ